MFVGGNSGSGDERSLEGGPDGERGEGSVREMGKGW
jgi:hypothetical protein